MDPRNSNPPLDKRLETHLRKGGHQPSDLRNGDSPSKAFSHHRPGLQAGGVALGGRSPLMAVHRVSQVEELSRSLAIESARGRGFGARWSFLYNSGKGFRTCWPFFRNRSPAWCRLGLRFHGWRDGFHPDLGLPCSRGLVLAPGRPASPPLWFRWGFRRRGLWSGLCRCLRDGLCNCFLYLSHF